MPQPTKAAAKARAATGEKKNQPKTVDFNGLKLTLPARLPGTIVFDLADVEQGNDLRGTMNLIESIVGVEQYQAIREKIAEDGLDIDAVLEALLSLLNDALAAFGLDPGE